jgi:sugar diacid utilization regulator
VIEHAARALSLELRVQLRGATSARPGRGADGLTRAVLTGEGATAATQREASFHGFGADAPRVVCLVQSRDGRTLDADAIASAVGASARASAVRSTTTDAGAVAIILEFDAATDDGSLPERARLALAGTIAEHDERDLAGAVSSLAVRADGLARRYEESAQILRLLIAVCPPEVQLLTAADLGAQRMLLGVATPELLEDFVTETLGSLLADDASSVDLIITLHAFLDAGRSPRAAAKRLAVHENTVRYRLTKVAELTGLDVAGNSDDQLTAQIALLILRLRGALPGVDVFGVHAYDVAPTTLDASTTLAPRRPHQQPGAGYNRSSQTPRAQYRAPSSSASKLIASSDCDTTMTDAAPTPLPPPQRDSTS